MSYSNNKPLVLGQARIIAKSPQIILDRYDDLWVIPPKCAQTSIRKWIGDDTISGNTSIADGRAKRRIMVVRHPVNRLASAYFNKYDNLARGEFLRQVLKTSDEACDIHVRSQTALLWDEYGRYHNPDVFIQFEKLEPALAGLRPGKPLPGHDNKSGRSAGEFAAMLPNETINQILLRYKHDYHLWLSLL